nr:hypothetical protein [uncultured Schaedlerella sp.]
MDWNSSGDSRFGITCSLSQARSAPGRTADASTNQQGVMGSERQESSSSSSQYSFTYWFDPQSIRME